MKSNESGKWTFKGQKASDKTRTPERKKSDLEKQKEIALCQSLRFYSECKPQIQNTRRDYSHEQLFIKVKPEYQACWRWRCRLNGNLRKFFGYMCYTNRIPCIHFIQDLERKHNAKVFFRG
ncbi:hypothetical protein EDEG_00640 [Edhazardia aedis USNM 41457]|uniref:Uncharacterized protein n=1 Tax=Edhazardia aedis (strain USNM 41457) TaxID=1003232 RepID=J9DCW0_EDHAE|nr:hypothetical protein EDEG_00640 [Edhazardia aedis USNM 41457]|eukprot:EJW05304.1 hypothetical protein EDEG_00640 [Edhazardia aedis USNM 41457]